MNKRIILISMLMISMLLSGCYNRMVTSYEVPSELESIETQGNRNVESTDDLIEETGDQIEVQVEAPVEIQVQEPTEEQSVTALVEETDIETIETESILEASGEVESIGTLSEAPLMEAETQEIETAFIEDETENTGVFTVSLEVIGIDGQVILASTFIETEATSVFQVLEAYCQEADIAFDYAGASSTAYIKGINNLYEFDYGPLSGWMYTVDGEFPSKSAGSFQVYDGAVLVFYYTKDNGTDIGAR